MIPPPLLARVMRWTARVFLVCAVVLFSVAVAASASKTGYAQGANVFTWGFAGMLALALAFLAAEFS